MSTMTDIVEKTDTCSETEKNMPDASESPDGVEQVPSTLSGVNDNETEENGECHETQDPISEVNNVAKEDCQIQNMPNESQNDTQNVPSTLSEVNDNVTQENGGCHEMQNPISEVNNVTEEERQAQNMPNESLEGSQNDNTSGEIDTTCSETPEDIPETQNGQIITEKDTSEPNGTTEITNKVVEGTSQEVKCNEEQTGIPTTPSVKAVANATSTVNQSTATSEAPTKRRRKRLGLKRRRKANLQMQEALLIGKYLLATQAKDNTSGEIDTKCSETPQDIPQTQNEQIIQIKSEPNEIPEITDIGNQINTKGRNNRNRRRNRQRQRRRLGFPEANLPKPKSDNQMKKEKKLEELSWQQQAVDMAMDLLDEQELNDSRAESQSRKRSRRRRRNRWKNLNGQENSANALKEKSTEPVKIQRVLPANTMGVKEESSSSFINLWNIVRTAMVYGPGPIDKRKEMGDEFDKRDRNEDAPNAKRKRV